ncbi:MAG TPA: oligosaccharide flippase family protein [Pyrinomonadaceae bacterium]|nr:oligosaccharide flippase family protein [Pyrinomonadaceae bacterium]
MKRVRSGISWNVSSSLIGQFIGFVRSVTLARLLAPEDFGLFTMALTIVFAASALTTIGLDRTIIASKFETQDELKLHLDTVWSAELIRSIIVALLISLSAFPTARFYGQAQLKFIIPVLACASLVQGLQNIGLVLLRKEISFGRIFWFELATNFSGVVLTIALAMVLHNVWALVFGMLLTAALGTLLSYVFHPYRPGLKFDRVALRSAVEFGKFAIVFAVASYVSNMADNIMVGRLLGTAALGNYSLAFNIASAPIIVVIFSLTAVLLPVYAEINSQDPTQLEPAFTKAFNLTLLIMFALALPFFLFAEEIVQLLFGSRWTTAGSVLTILALVIPLRGLTLITSTVFWSANRPRAVAIARTLDAIVFVAALYPLTRAFGLTGVAWAGFIAYAFACLNRVIALNKIIPGISSKLLRVLLPALIILVVMLLVRALTSR